jgi:hypothetical protein
MMNANAITIRATLDTIPRITTLYRAGAKNTKNSEIRQIGAM